MKILQLNNYHFIKGGADRVYFNTAKLLKDHQHEVQYFSSRHPNNVPAEYVKKFASINDNRETNFLQKIGGAKDYIYNKSAYKNLGELLKEYKPDIAHLHLFYGGLSGSVLKALKKHNVPIVETVHDYRLLCPANAFLDSNNQICEKCKNKSYYQCATNKCLEGNFFYSSILALEAYTRKYLIDPLDYINHFIFVSRFSQQKHIEFNDRYLNKSTHLYNFTSIPEQFLESNNESYFLFFGRLSKEKGLHTLLDAAIKNNINLKIAGTGPLQNEIAGYAENNKNIEFLGYQSGDMLTQLIKASSFIIVPSEWYENNPMTIIEAYALGKPVIGANIGGIPEIVIDNYTGFLFKSRDANDLANAIMRGKQLSGDEYVTMSANARNFAEVNFSADAHYEKLIAVYAQIIKND
jgi:glycosyltransferase involved in cell wall biosynthesis